MLSSGASLGGLGLTRRRRIRAFPIIEPQSSIPSVTSAGCRLIAGFFVILSVALGYWVNPGWFFFTAFVGLNLFQSAFTNWCPMMTILRKLGVPGAR